MDDLVVWLRAQLDEDQWYAEEAASHAAATGTFIGKGTRWHAQDYDRLWAVGDDESKPDRKLAECGHGGFRLTSYLARHDPARVLREIDAKRQLLDELLPDLEHADRLIEGEWGSGDDVARRFVRLLSLPYSDRPGYREEWRP